MNGSMTRAQALEIARALRFHANAVRKVSKRDKASERAMQLAKARELDNAATILETATRIDITS